MKCSKQITLILIIFQLILMSSLQVVSSENTLKIKKQNIEALFKASLDSKNKSASEEASKTLVNLESKNPKRFLEVWFEIILYSTDKLVRQEASKALKKLESRDIKKITEALIQISSDSKDKLVRQEASKTLEDVKLRRSEEFIRALTEISLEGRDNLKQKAFEILEKMRFDHPKKVSDAFVQIILEGRDDLRQKAFQTLKEMRFDHPEVIEDLARVGTESKIKSEQQEVIEILKEMRFDHPERVIKALARIGSGGSVGTGASSELYFHLHKPVFNLSFRGIGRVVIEILDEMKSTHPKEVIKALTEMGSLNKLKSVRKKSLNILKQMSSTYPEKVIEALIEINLRSIHFFEDTGRDAIKVLDEMKSTHPEKVIEAVTEIFVNNEKYKRSLKNTNSHLFEYHEIFEILKEMKSTHPEKVTEALTEMIRVGYRVRLGEDSKKPIEVLKEINSTHPEKVTNILLKIILTSDDNLFLVREALVEMKSTQIILKALSEISFTNDSSDIKLRLNVSHLLEDMRRKHPKEVINALTKMYSGPNRFENALDLLEDMRRKHPKEVINALVKIILTKDGWLDRAFDILKKMKIENRNFSKILERAISENLDNEKSLKHYKGLFSKNGFERLKISVQGKRKATRK